jgi:hypothetical protein
MVNGEYMDFLANNLRVLHAITGDRLFETYANKWSDYQDNDKLFIELALKEFLKSSKTALPGAPSANTKGEDNGL